MLDLPQFINADCMDVMKEIPDKYFELAIVDPPYGIGVGEMRMGAGNGPRTPNINNRKWSSKDWDSKTPDSVYFTELMRVSQNQIIWGGNYFQLSPTRCFLIWDKGEGFYNRTYAEAELAWASFDKNVRIFKRDPLARGDYRGKIHPTQKPVALYRWLLKNYAKEGDKILDTHVGSASSLVACEEYGFDYLGIELDPDYYQAAKKRLETFKAQGRLF